jgi:ribosomal protein S18 acetylase RimI-like enzyme
VGVRVRPIRDDDRDRVRSILLERWGDEIVVGHGVVFRPAGLDGFVAQDDDGSLVGVLTFEMDGEALEVVTVDAVRRRQGIGSALMLAAIERAHAAACARVRVMTTNDNVPAIALYGSLGFRVREVRAGAVEASRALKPSIPRVGLGGVPITDEIDFELEL